MLAGATAMVTVGGSAAVSGLLGGAPLASAQAVRYAAAAGLLIAFSRLSDQRLQRPRGREWLWLVGVAGFGLVLFNVALVRGAGHAEPAVFGVAVASVPLVLAVAGSLTDRRPPSPRLALAATAVTAGAVLVQGLGRSDIIGLAWALVVLVCEAGFTLLALPLLPRHGPIGVSVHATGIAAVVFGVLGVITEGPTALLRLTALQLWAVAYLAVAVTALAFVLWYGSVRRLGAGRAGLLTGVAPIAAAITGVALGGPLPSPAVWVGVAVVAAGLAWGLLSPTDEPPSRPVRSPSVLPSCPDGAR